MTKMHPCMGLWRVVTAAILISTHLQTSTYTVNGLARDSLDLFKVVTSYMFGNTVINMDTLLQEYSTICPITEQCDIQHMSDRPNTSYDTRRMPSRDCPVCNCDFICISNNNCCLGSYFGYLRFGWTDTVVFRSSQSNISTHAVAMISTCPANFAGDGDVEEKCMGVTSEMFIYSSNTTKLTYRNRYCAECHNDTDLTPWIPRILCDDKYTVANMYTYTRSELDDKNCYIQFTGPFEVAFTQEPKTYNIDKCNITGLWKKFDSDINWACENVLLQYRDFKNVFCYICNPSIASTRSTPVIDTCNTTGAWSTFDAEVAHACATQQKTERLSPYKNIYCLICNGFNNTAIPNKFGLSFVETLYTNTSVIHISAAIETENAIQNMQSFLATLNNNKIYSPEWTALYKRVDADADISRQILNLQQVCGNVCEGNTSRFTHANTLCPQNCSCDRDCAELFNCCPDMIIKHRPYNCFEEQHFPTWRADDNGLYPPDSPSRTHLVIDTCPVLDNVSQMCIGNNSHDDILSQFPLRTNSHVLYKNVYCLQCNTRSAIAYFDIEIFCNNHLEFQLFVDFDDLLQGIKQHCMITFGSRGSTPCKRTYQDRIKDYLGRPQIQMPPYIDSQQREDVVSAYIVHGNTTFTKCNQTMKWSEEDKDIRQLCEGEDETVLALPEYRVNGFVYKNFACLICNPAVDKDSVTSAISSCNVTGAWTPSQPDSRRQLDQSYLQDMADLCNRTHLHPVWLPFKNYFCSECNLPYFRTYVFPMPVQTGIEYRYLFNLSEDNLREFRNDGVVTGRLKKCTGGTYDVTQERCRPLFCPAHRMIVNDQCQPIPSLQKDTYIVMLELRPIRGQFHHHGNQSCFSSSDDITSEAKRVVRFSDIMHDIIQQMIVSTYWKSIQCNISVDSPCGRDIDTVYFTWESAILFSYSFEAGGLNLSQIEMSLLQILSKPYTLFTSTSCELTFKAEQKQWHLDISSQNGSHIAESCTFRHIFDDTSFNSDTFVVIDYFFECPQKQFLAYEFEHLSRSTVIKTYENLYIPEKYVKMVGSNIRICLYVFQSYWFEQQRYITSSRTLILVKTVAGCVSVTALMLTFITYCAFAQLRTLPGKNMMLLIVCLSCALCFDVIKEYVPAFTVMCQIVGSFTHYFLLATFFSLNVCSFHIMRVFYIQAQSTPTIEKRSKLFYKYLSYVLVAPLVFVVLHASCSLLQVPGFEYGPDCFISGIGILSSFIVPTVILFVVNYIFFSVGFHKIRTTKKISATNRHTRNDFVVCLKLLLLMGITWPFMVIYMIFANSTLVFVVIGLNSFQGLYLFIAYVCNRRVIALYKAALCSNQVVTNT